jgi:hypothetical protein
VLSIKGRVLGSVRKTHLEIDHLVDPEPVIDPKTMAVTASADLITGFSWRRRWWVFKREYENGEMFNSALVCLAHDNPLWNCHLELFLLEFSKIYRGEASANTSSALQLTRQDTFQNLEPFWDLLEYLLMSRTICEMEDSRLLVAPDIAQSGDAVEVLAGCTNPVIMRRDRTDGTFRLLGDAQVLGVKQQDTMYQGLEIMYIT